MIPKGEHGYITFSTMELRDRFDKYIRRIKLGDCVLITRYGKPIAEYVHANTPLSKQKQAGTDLRKEKTIDSIGNKEV